MSAPYPAPAAPQPMTPADERMWSILTHIGGIFFGFVASLITFLVFKDRGPFVREHTRTALNFQLTVLVWAAGGFVVILIGIPLSVIGVGIPLLILAWLVLVGMSITMVVLSVIAAVAASKGQWYRYPMSIQFVR